MKSAVEQAVAEIRAALPKHQVDMEADTDGGAYVTVHGLHIGDQHAPASSWVAFHIVYQYPHADIYPFHCVAELRRVDGNPLGAGTSQAQWRGNPATVLSRKSNRRNPETETALLKLHKVLEWIRSL